MTGKGETLGIVVNPAAQKHRSPVGGPYIAQAGGRRQAVLFKGKFAYLAQ